MNSVFYQFLSVVIFYSPSGGWHLQSPPHGLQGPHPWLNETSVRFTREGGSSYRLELDNGITYQLRRRTENPGVWSLDDNQIIRRELRTKEVDLYESEAMGSSVTVSMDQTGDYQISGVLEPGITISPGCPACPHRVQYSLSNEPSDRSDYQQVEARYPRVRQGKGIKEKGKVQPEILIIVDYFLFEKLNFNKEETQKYVVSFCNAVNLRFATINSPKIQLQIAGILISESKTSLSYITENIEKGNVIDAASTLHDMGRYFYKDRLELPVYDIVITMTGLDMARMKKGVRIRATSGYAYVGGACVRNVYLKKISSVALVEDSGGYSGVIVAAHEIGHLLGAVHDGDAAPSYLRGPGAKSCPWSEGYIMSDRRYTARGQLWSDCSVKQMKHFLSTTTAQCLYNIPTNTDFSLPGQLSLPGSSLSLDQQCRADKGTRACYHDHRVCAQLFCYTNNFSGCYATRPAVEGSSCGQNRHCISGKCVHKSQSHNRRRTNSKDKTKNNNSNKCLSGKCVSKVNHHVGIITTTTTEKHTTTTTTTTTTSTGVSVTATAGPTTTVTSEPEKIRDKMKNHTTGDDKKRTKKNKPSKKLHIEHAVTPRMPKHHSENPPDLTDCSDSLKVLGSLTCPQLFQRYAFHYCKNNRVIKKKCCVSYHKFCARNLPR